MSDDHKGYLFEVSWEVCNKVGGIYTVITSKVTEAIKNYGDRYLVLGPDFKTNIDFEETDEDYWTKIREGTAMKELSCRFGRWKIPGEPRAILVNFSKRYNKDQLLYQIWEDYGVDSIAGGWDYVEPVMFSCACSEVIEIIYNLMARPQGESAVAHFHEWMCGAGLLSLKKRVPEIGTVFTTHATILGRTLAGSGVDIYNVMDNLSPQREAAAHNITAKYSMETVSTREADCFTTVSDITATEAKNFLGRYPDVITPNGLDIEHIPDLAENRAPALKSREKLLQAASRFLRREFPVTSKIMVISGRYEFHNKGIDIFLNALGRLEKKLSDKDCIVAFLFVLGGHTDLIPSLQGDFAKFDPANPPLATHRLHYEASDQILETCNRLGLKNTPQNRVSVIFIPAYLNGHDGLINMTYYEALSGCDLGVFPSYYEPWGYTPLESAAYAVPTVTTDQAGFGLWVQRTIGDTGGVYLLRGRGQDRTLMEDHLLDILVNFLNQSDEQMIDMRRSARAVAMKANWTEFFKEYVIAYDRSLSVAHDRMAKLALRDYRIEKKLTFAATVSTQPHFRSFTAIANLPKNIERLRELAYNVWWAWHPRALDLFASLDFKLWADMGSNPVRMLESISPETLQDASRNTAYIGLYKQVIQQFDDYMTEKETTKGLLKSEEIKGSSPVVYFSTEYGLHESIPIYSGGLGTLSGDHLKTASDLNIPMVAVGLLYKSGYFRQVIDRNGIQIAEYPENDLSFLPVQIIKDDRGDEVQISLDLPGRTLFANIWEIKVGRVSLYLLDTDVQRNTTQDRKITARLYPADQRTRIEQEILLGMGGVLLLKKLGIRPRVYHINEGHSAFLIFERIMTLMSEGFSFDEASEIVRGSTVFTTHTPVEAGNERFSRELMEHYFSNFIKRTGMSWSQFWELGRKEIGDDKPFFMTILALKMTNMSNAVSKMHGQVARQMWRDVWKGFHDSDIPIRHVTNGAHVMSYLAQRMKDIYDGYLGPGWVRNLTDTERWEKVQDIPDALLWKTRFELKQKTIDYLKDYISKNWMKYNYTKTWREELFTKINPGALLIGFSRRFAPYKRADMIFYDLDRLDKLLNNPLRPVHIVFAGKAHPNDEMGKNLIKKVIDVCKDERFRGKVFFIEDYDLRVARHLVQGVDVWLNNPRRPLEASGTSGEKVVINGVLNLSISDGWWCEGYDGTNGWTIGPVVRDYYDEDRSDTSNVDEQDSQSLYALLENTVVPMFFDRELSGLPEKWIAMIKNSIQTLVPQFNTERMLLEYYHNMYLPTAKRDLELTRNGYQLAREISDWKSKIPMRFSSLKLLDVTVEGIHGDDILVDKPLNVNVRIDPGKLEPGEIIVEMLIGEQSKFLFVKDPEYVPLSITNTSPEGILTYSVEYTVRQNGPHCYGVRVLPYNKNLASRYETGLVLWG
jgi:phosphorylase/glycogen(starch) synthase